MSGKSKVNPNRQPATQADVERAYEAGYVDGYRNSAILWLTVLYDDEQADDETVQRVYKELAALAQTVNDGIIGFGKLADVLRKKHGIDVTKY